MCDILIILASESVTFFLQQTFLLTCTIFHNSSDEILRHVTATFVNRPFNEEEKFVSVYKDTLHRSSWKNWELEQSKSSEAAKNLVTGWVDRRPRSTAENIIVFVTSYSVRKVCHRHIRQYLKFQAVLEFVSHQLITLFTIFFQSKTHPEERTC